ncbi:hypothetical protein EV561_119110 [Rhizobium sp. BK376]|nr:hypothetical protein EV561_119110 [Rhizobium sp. BK376]
MTSEIEIKQKKLGFYREFRFSVDRLTCRVKDLSGTNVHRPVRTGRHAQCIDRAHGKSPV